MTLALRKVFFKLGNILMEFHFESRYPEEQRQFYKKCTKEFTEQNLGELKKVFQWLRQRLENR